MVHAKNYETMSIFVKVMPRNTVASFFSGHGVDEDELKNKIYIKRSSVALYDGTVYCTAVTVTFAPL